METLKPSDEQQKLLEFLKNKDVLEARKLLVEKNISPVLVRDAHGETPLHWAANTNNSDIVSLIIEKGCYTNANNFYNTSPLYYACSTDSVNSIRLLLENHTDPNTKSGFSGESALNACKSEEAKEIMNQAIDKQNKARENIYIMFRYRVAVFWRVTFNYMCAPNKRNMYMGFEPCEEAHEIGKKDMKALLEKCKDLDRAVHHLVDEFSEGRVNEKFCLYCSKEHTEEEPLKICPSCKKVYFCTQECQKKSWKELMHSFDCKKV